MFKTNKALGAAWRKLLALQLPGPPKRSWFDQPVALGQAFNTGGFDSRNLPAFDAFRFWLTDSL
jgi:hypothetical protein